MPYIRNYRSEDYDQVKALYLQGDLYGGQFDEARDSYEKLDIATKIDPQCILVYERDDKILGTISLIETGRVAWLYRFAAKDQAVIEALYKSACAILKMRSHSQVLVYTPAGNTTLKQRYADLGMEQGYDYTCYWHDL
ncbi:MAG TPA: hypothetical protein VIN59_00010 [Alphaproteobacteria bacterium]